MAFIVRSRLVYHWSWVRSFLILSLMPCRCILLRLIGIIPACKSNSSLCLVIEVLF